MDPVAEIKARLPIEMLVGEYCQLKKKGRGFVCVCPFHSDTHPSMQVSPDKGIAYCFACSSGGDIFSFYQKIENVDFPQAIKDLAEKTGVKVEGIKPPKPEEKDRKVRLKECLESALSFYRSQLAAHAPAAEYLKKRGIPAQQIEEFELGYAPDSFSDTYQHLLKSGFSQSEIVDASLGIKKDLSEGKIYDRFRNRIMFPIRDAHGALAGFGGRTLGDDDAKYINSGETPLYNKSSILFGLHLAKDAIREKKRVVLVEGYFDLLACHRIGITNSVAVSGTALTDLHVRALKRMAESVVLCLDQDRAGREASERAFHLCAPEGLEVRAVEIAGKDPDEAAIANPDAVRDALAGGGSLYLDLVLRHLAEEDCTSAEGKRSVERRMLPLIKALPSAVERDHYVERTAHLLSTTKSAVQEDLDRMAADPIHAHVDAPANVRPAGPEPFSSAEIALGMLCMFPKLRSLMSEFIEPDDVFVSLLYRAVRDMPASEEFASVESLKLAPEFAERASILLLFCEHHGFLEWSESLAAREIRRNCANANKDLLRRKQREVAEKLMKARKEGRSAEEDKLSTEYQEILKLAKLSIQ